MTNYKIAVIGAGAIGGISAAMLKKAGYDVELVCKYESIAKKANEGMQITGVYGDINIPINSVVKVEELTSKKDFIMVATKAYDMPDVCRKALRFADENTLFVSMQNGICTDAMAEVVGKDRTVGCVVGFGATMIDSGILEMTSTGTLTIGMENGTGKAKLNELRAVLGTIVPTDISENILSDLYSKLIVNSCISSLGVICGLKLGEMLKIKKVRKIFIEIMREAMMVADKIKLQVPPYGGKLDYYSLFKGDNFIAKVKRHLTIRIVGMKYKNLKSSSLQSLNRGRPTEIDYFNGYIYKKGIEFEVDTPINKAIIDIVKEIENHKREISVKNFDDKAFQTI